MSRPLPKCAWCGLSLVRQNYITTSFDGVLGRPTIGWHDRCDGLDSLGLSQTKHPIERPLEYLAAIRERGNPRIVSLIPNGMPEEFPGSHYANGLRIEVAMILPTKPKIAQ